VKNSFSKTRISFSKTKFNLWLKPQAPSSKLQAPSKKELDSHKIPDIK